MNLSRSQEPSAATVWAGRPRRRSAERMEQLAGGSGTGEQ